MRKDLDRMTADERLLEACSLLDADGIKKALDDGANVNADDGSQSSLVKVLEGDRYWFAFDKEDDITYGEDEDVPPDVCEERAKRAVAAKIRCLGLLLEYGVDVNAAPSGEWSVGFHAVNAEPEVLRFLLENGLNPNIATLWRGGSSEMPLHYAWGEALINRNDVQLTKELRRSIRLLLEYGALPYSPDDMEEQLPPLEKIRTFEHVPPIICPSIPSETKTLSAADNDLFTACRNNDIAAARKALAGGADPNARDLAHDFETPLLAAVGCDLRDSVENPTEEDRRQWDEKKKELARILIENGSDPNLGEVSVLSGDGEELGAVETRTPLHEAAWLGKNVELSRFLLEHGANPNVVTEDPDRNTIRDMNDWDYNVDAPADVRPIEELLGRYGGCCHYIFDPDAHSQFSDAEKALIFGCQRLDYSAVMSAVNQGADISLHEWGDRCLPVIAMNDAPQLLGRYFALNGWVTEDEVCDFVLYLLGGMQMPIGDKEADEILRSCIKNGYEKVLDALVHHHKYGILFQERGRLLKNNLWPWECWPKDKQRRMTRVLSAK